MSSVKDEQQTKGIQIEIESRDPNDFPIYPNQDLNGLRWFAYHLKTIWLFTASDHKTFVLPETIFGIAGATSGLLTTEHHISSTAEILSRFPTVLLWTWLNTLVFVLSNQGNYAAIKEDSLNKPWRPLPAGRITLRSTRQFQLFAIPTVLLITCFFEGAFTETAVLFSLTWMYNDLEGADKSFITRNAIIAAVYAFYGSGALKVASGQDSLDRNAYYWLGLTSSVILTTMSIQDLKDQECDRARGRHTAPLVIGETKTRLGVASAIVLWSGVCSMFWRVGPITFTACMVFGLIDALNLVLKKGFEADRSSWKLWAYWLIVLYCLPLFKTL